MYFLIGVTKFLIWIFKWEPILLLNNLNIYIPFSTVYSLFEFNAVFNGHTNLGSNSINFYLEFYSSIIYLQTL
jgi:hypothetical protein